MKIKSTARVILIVLVMLAASLACISGGGGGDGPTGADITATYGAELFHAQLTAQAGGQP